MLHRTRVAWHGLRPRDCGSFAVECVCLSVVIAYGLADFWAFYVFLFATPYLDGHIHSVMP